MKYRAQESAYKQLIREYLLEKIEEHGCFMDEDPFSLTLCNTAFWLERKLIEKYKGRVICYERDEQVYDKITNLLDKDEDIHVVYGDLFNHLGSSSFNFAWLDFCNSYTDDFMTKIVDFVGKLKWADKAILSITLNKKRGQPGEDMIYNKFYPDYKDNGFAEHVAQFINGRVEKVEKIRYICSDISTRGGIMNVFTFFINKN